ncbi:MAG: hypothetical protein AAB517_01870 [Patescibacteria group bacterium]
MTTKVVIITHPDYEERSSVRLTNYERSALLSILKSLEKFVVAKNVAVLAPTAPEVIFYAKSIARHFGLDEPEICECLLRNGDGELDANDGCDCIADFISPQFDLIIAIAADGFSETLANSLSKQIKRPCSKIHKTGMNAVYVI